MQRRQIDTVSVLAEVLDGLAAATTMPEVQRVIRSAPRRLLGAFGATFVLREGDQCYYADEDAASPLWKGQRFPITQCISGWAMLHDSVVVVPDITLDARIPQAAYRPTFVRSLVMVPVGRPAVAAIGAYWGYVRSASRRELRALGRVAAAGAEAVARLDRAGGRPEAAVA